MPWRGLHPTVDGITLMMIMHLKTPMWHFPVTLAISLMLKGASRTVFVIEQLTKFSIFYEQLESFSRKVPVSDP